MNGHLEGQRREVTVRDELLGSGKHVAIFYVHLAEQCIVEQAGLNRFSVNCGKGTVIIEFEPNLSVSMARGIDEPIIGWVSRAYHRKEPSPTLKANCEWKTRLTTVTRIAIG